MVIKPYRLYVSRVDTIENDEAKFTIHNVSDQEIGLTVVSQPIGYFQLTLPQTSPSGRPPIVAEGQPQVSRRALREVDYAGIE